MATLRNKKVLITAGPTREYWDPVRYLTNASSGMMGLALAREAKRHGAKVTVVLGPVGDMDLPKGITFVPVVSAWDMYQAVKRHLPGTHTFVGTAAVVDYRPAEPLKLKIKHKRPEMTLKLYGNPDIIAMVGHLPSRRPKTVIGFALETDHLMENALDKLVRKRMDWIVANRESNMGRSKAAGTLLSRWGDKVVLPTMSKDRFAVKLWQSVTTLKK